MEDADAAAAGAGAPPMASLPSDGDLNLTMAALGGGDVAGLAPHLLFAPAGGGGDLGLGLDLDDIFGDLYFTPDGELLVLPSDDESSDPAAPPVTLSAPLPASTLPPLPPAGESAAAPVAAPAPPPVKGVAGLGITLPRHARFGAPTRVKSEYSDDGDSDEKPSGGGASKRPRPRPGGLSMTDEQKLERRERNREHAKRSRVRKKFLLDSLQCSVNALEEENRLLKGAIRDRLGPECEPLLAACVPDPDSLVAATPGRSVTQVLDDPDYSLVKALQTAQQNFVITDASQPDNPIVYASAGFVELTGYASDQILGRNCRFLQGPETDPRAVDKIRRAVERGEDTSVCLLNYRADGEKFWNQFFVAALRDADGKIVNFVGVQCKVSEDYAKIVVQKQEKSLEDLHKQREKERQRLGRGCGGGGGASSSAGRR